MNEAIHPALHLFTEKHPLTASLNMRFLPENGGDRMKVEVDAPVQFADADGKYVHTGFHTLLLDTVMGSCAIGKLEQLQPIATIKLNCNHMRKVEIGDPLVCIADWTGEENSISYVTGEIRRRSDDAVISNAIGTFMVGTASRPLSEKL